MADWELTWTAKNSRAFRGTWGRKHPVTEGYVEISINGPTIRLECKNFRSGEWKNFDSSDIAWIRDTDDRSGYLSFNKVSKVSGSNIVVNYRVRPAPTDSGNRKRRIEAKPVGTGPETWEAEEG